MNQWLNQSHPMTLKAAVILGYLSAVFGLLSGNSFTLLLYIGIGVGAFLTANNKRIGYYILAGCASLVVIFLLALSLPAFFSFDVVSWLWVLNLLVFPVALVAAALHVQSREYQQIWFE